MEQARADEYLLALVSAYVWVAAADHGIGAVEYNRFGHAIIESPFATQFDESHIRRYFKDMVSAFEDDFEAAMALTKGRLKGLRGQGIFSEEIIRMCRAAAVSDGRLRQSEENALEDVARILDIPEPSLS